MSQKMINLAKRSWKLLVIELFVPGGTLVVLAILLARASAPWGLGSLAALFLTPARDAKGADNHEYYLKTN